MRDFRQNCIETAYIDCLNQSVERPLNAQYVSAKLTCYRLNRDAIFGPVTQVESLG